MKVGVRSRVYGEECRYLGIGNRHVPFRVEKVDEQNTARLGTIEVNVWDISCAIAPTH